MFNCSTNCLCPIRFAPNGDTSLLNENFQFSLLIVILTVNSTREQGSNKIIFTACHPGKLKLAFTNPDVISTSPKSFLTRTVDFTVLPLFEFFKKRHLPVGQVKNRIHQPDSKIRQPRAIVHYFLCTLHKFHFHPQIAGAKSRQAEVGTCTAVSNKLQINR